jgi:hypothetical protein
MWKIGLEAASTMYDFSVKCLLFVKRVMLIKSNHRVLGKTLSRYLWNTYFAPDFIVSLF